MKNEEVVLATGEVVSIQVPKGNSVKQSFIYSVGYHDTGEEKLTQISELIWNDGIVEYSHTREIFYLIKGVDVVHGGIFEHIASRADLAAENQKALQRELAAKGAGLVPKHASKVFNYLYKQRPEKVYQCLTTTGWHTLNNKVTRVYASPYNIYGTDEPTVRYMPHRVHPSHKNIYPSCSVNDQKEKVADMCINSPVLLFAIGHALSALMATPLKRDCLSVHWYGATTSGKTTTLQVAASIMGNGSAPNTDPDSTSLQTWNTTSNALELLATGFNDMLLVVDELGVNNGKDLGQDLYKLFNGITKARMNADGSQRHQETWRVSVVSSGELSTEQMMLGVNGRNTIKGGQLIRCNDIPAQDVLICPDEDVAAYGDRLKHNASQYFGAFGDAMLHYLAEVVNKPDALAALKAECIAAEESIITSDLTPPQRRSIKRLGLVKLALMKAVKLGFIDDMEDTIHDTVITIRDLWLDNSVVISDLDRAITKLRNFIRQNPLRFRPVKSEEASPQECRDIIGYYDSRTNLYHFIPEELKQFCDMNRVHTKELLKKLVIDGHLDRNNKDNGKYRNTSRRNIDGAGRGAFYSIKGSFLHEFSSDDMPDDHRSSILGGAFI